ncbi:MAG: hypothetical protein KDB10_13615, partial [Acidimicrobiales bacterium]|nr:hypothetical protein [Acidimicrobiales bacterium]
MTPTEPSPDDLLVSAVLDGHASPEEVARVASDPRLAARLEQFRHAAGAVGGPVPLVDPAVREAHLARARAEARPGATGAPEAPRPVGDLAAARARRRTTGRATTILSIAAAVVLLAAVGAFLVGQLGSGGTSSDEVATATDEGGADEARAADAQDDSASSGGDAPEAATASPPSTTVPGGEAFAPDGGTGIDPSLPSLGTFDDVGGFVARVRGQTVLDPTPEDL